MNILQAKILKRHPVDWLGFHVYSNASILNNRRRRSLLCCHDLRCEMPRSSCCQVCQSPPRRRWKNGTTWQYLSRWIISSQKHWQARPQHQYYNCTLTWGSDLVQTDYPKHLQLKVEILQKLSGSQTKDDDKAKVHSRLSALWSLIYWFRLWIAVRLFLFPRISIMPFRGVLGCVCYLQEHSSRMQIRQTSRKDPRCCWTSLCFTVSPISYF